MPKRQITLEQVLYISAFIIALGIRFINLGSAPLSEIEAQSALLAYNLAAGDLPEAVSHPAYTLITSYLFSIFGSSEFLARLLPALVGFGLVVIPLTLREQLGKTAALVLTFGLAVDPMLVGMSRLAGSPILAYVFTLAAGIAFYKGKKVGAGILFGLMLLSGSTAIAGAFVLALAWAISQVTLKSRNRRNRKERWSPAKLLSEREFFLSAFVTMILAGSFFLRVPSGLSAIGATLPNYLSGWQSQPSIPFSQFVLALIAYQPLALIFGLVAITRSFLQLNTKLIRSLGFWLIAGLLLTLTYPARQITDLVWVITPLWILAAIEISKHLEWGTNDRMASIGQTGLTLLLLTFLIMFTARSVSAPAFSFPDSGLQIFGVPIGLSQQVITTFSIIGLAAISTLLIASGWSKDAASQGLVTGISIFITIFMFSSSFNNISSPRRIVNE
ncbi:MAG: glycosyltransferase family 39 protein, partial [Chloroflexota bacterium]